MRSALFVLGAKAQLAVYICIAGGAGRIAAVLLVGSRKGIGGSEVCQWLVVGRIDIKIGQLFLLVFLILLLFWPGIFGPAHSRSMLSNTVLFCFGGFV